MKTKKVMLMDVVETYANQNKDIISHGTNRKIQAYVRLLHGYEHETSKEYFINAINTDFFKKLIEYCNKKYSSNYIAGVIKFLKSICHKNGNDIKFYLKRKKSSLVYLTPEEINSFSSVPTSPGTSIDLHKDLFVFASSVGGLRHSDLLKLQWKHIIGKIINYPIMKSHCQLIMPINDKGLQILHKYRPEIANPEAFVFPASSQQKINFNIQQIAKKAGIDKDIFFNTSRKTFLAIAIINGIPIELIANIMGYSYSRMEKFKKEINNNKSK